MNKFLLTTYLIAASGLYAKAQTCKWVAARNLNLREYPEDKAQVFVVLHAPAKVRMAAPQSDKRPAIQAKWVEVDYTAEDASGRSESWGGWVLKQYLTTDSAKAAATGAGVAYTVPEARKNIEPSVTINNKTIYTDGRSYYHDKKGCYFVLREHKFYVKPSYCR